MRTFELELQERLLISGAMRDPRIVPAIDLEPSDFAQPQAGRVWAEMRRRARGDGWRGADELATQTAATREQVDAYQRFLYSCEETCGLPGDVPGLAEIVRSAAVTRAALSIGDSARRLEEHGLEGEELVAALIRELTEHRNRVSRRKSRTLAELLELVANATCPDVDAEGSSRCVPMGLDRLDAGTGGWPGGVVSVVGGRTSMGKSALMLQCAIAAGRRGSPAHLCSAEDLEGDTGQRVLAQLSGVPALRIRRRHELSAEERAHIEAAHQAFDGYRGVRLTPISGLTAEQVVAQVRIHQHRDATAIVFVDYLQRIRLQPGAKRYEGLAHAMDVFDRAAKEDGLPWVIGSQLRRSENEYPALSDFRDSGAIEEIAKMAIGIYRPGRGKPTSEDDAIRIAVLKSSNGATLSGWFRWDGERTQILNEEPPSMYQ